MGHTCVQTLLHPQIRVTCMSILHLNASVMVFKVIFIINTTHSTVGDTDNYGCVSCMYTVYMHLEFRGLKSKGSGMGGFFARILLQVKS